MMFVYVFWSNFVSELWVLWVHKTGARVVAFYRFSVSDLHGTNYYYIKAS